MLLISLRKPDRAGAPRLWKRGRERGEGRCLEDGEKERITLWHASGPFGEDLPRFWVTQQGRGKPAASGSPFDGPGQTEHAGHVSGHQPVTALPRIWLIETVLGFLEFHKDLLEVLSSLQVI